MARKPFPKATVTAVTESANEHGELLIRATYRGRRIEQTVPIQGGCVALFLDSDNGNVLPVPISVPPGNLELLDVVEAAS